MKPGLQTTYYSWSGMKQRCTNPNHIGFKDYGKKGIRVCTRWLTWSNFLEDMGVKPKRTSLDRINNELGYSPENCKWSSRHTQEGNKSYSVDFVGVTECKLSAERHWLSRICIKGKQINLGRFKTHLAACYARHQANLHYKVYQ